jgi:hypothetical protein
VFGLWVLFGLVNIFFTSQRRWKEHYPIGREIMSGPVDHSFKEFRGSGNYARMIDRAWQCDVEKVGGVVPHITLYIGIESFRVGV